MEATEKARQFARAFSVGTCSVGENGSMQEAIKTAANHPPPPSFRNNRKQAAAGATCLTHRPVFVDSNIS
jgi:hypothetical protein